MGGLFLMVQKELGNSDVGYMSTSLSGPPPGGRRPFSYSMKRCYLRGPKGLGRPPGRVLAFSWL